MQELKRATRKSIEEFLKSGLITVGTATTCLGYGTIRHSHIEETQLIVCINHTKSRVNVEDILSDILPNSFLDTLENYLEREKLFVTELQYKTKRLHGLIPARITGIFYQEMELPGLKELYRKKG